MLRPSVSGWWLPLVAALAIPARLAVAEEQPPPEMIADRIAVQLTGVPAPGELRSAFVAGTISVPELAEALRKTPQFETKLARYWLSALKLNDIVDVRGIRDPQKAAGAPDSGVTTSLARGMPVDPASMPIRVNDDLSIQRIKKAGDEARASFFQEQPRKRRLFFTDRACAGGTRQRLHTLFAFGNAFAQQVRMAADQGKIELRAADGSLSPVTLTAEQKAEYVAISDWGKRATGCSCATAVSVTPFWDPGRQVHACPGVVEESVCGSDFIKCFPDVLTDGNVDPENTYLQSVNYSLTMEPAAIIARIVKEDLSFDEVFRTTKGLINAPVEHFLKSFGQVALNVQPPGSYPEFASRPVPSDPRSLEFEWIERGPLHAGVLTTIAFHRSTNGWRAKANRVVNAFLCKEFKVPDDTKQVASTEVDLTRKPYCQNCHATLEPLSQFFGRWPTLGQDNNYFYDPSNGVSAVGTFANVTDADTLGLARVLSGLRDFDECSVRRAFEFVVGRTMNEWEMEHLLGPLTDEFVANQKRMFPTMLRIVQTPAFFGGEP